jgi:hypothetical protein
VPGKPTSHDVKTTSNCKKVITARTDRLATSNRKEVKTARTDRLEAAENSASTTPKSNSERARFFDGSQSKLKVAQNYELLKKLRMDVVMLPHMPC